MTGQPNGFSTMVGTNRSMPIGHTGPLQQTYGLEQIKALRLLEQGTHLSVLPHFPMRLLREHFALVELALPVPAMPRPIHLWCRSQLLEDAAFAAMRETILGYVAE